MKSIKLLLLMSLLFFVGISFSQNTVTYTSLTNTINLNSGEEGTVDVLVNCYGNSSNPVFLNATLSCGNNDGILSQSYTNGNTLIPGQNTKIRFKFKKTVTVDTQIVYKFSTNGSCFQSESQMIKITVNYKKGSTTVPPVIDPGLIYMGFWPNTSVTINEGDVAPVLTGGSQSGYKYQWYSADNGIFTLIPGATSYYYYPGPPFVTTKYFRQKQNMSGSPIGRSNEIIITVNPAPVIQNNTITLNGSTIYGSLPIGGIGTYQYSWVLWGGEEPYEFPDTGQNLELPSWIYNEVWENLKANSGVIIVRFVKSGKQVVSSNLLKLPPLQSNKIASNESIIDGDFPKEELLAVYPNPTSESVNFGTNFLDTKEIEIIFYSEKLGDQKTIFKGTVIRSQVVKWNIPSNYKKGLYFYKILSGNKEIKTGKILYQ